MKKIFILLSVMLIATGSTVYFAMKVNPTPKLEQVNVSDKKADEKVEDNSQSQETETQEKITPKETESKKQDTEVAKEQEIKKNIPKVKTPTSNSTTKKQNSSNTQTTTKKADEKPQENKPTQSSTQNNNANQSNNKSSNQTQKNVVSTTFYDSITGGKKEFSSESEAFARGTQIQNNELDYVLDYNEAHPDSPIQPDINYFRVYPSVIDENGKYWYYLHFFCQSGEGNDAKLKSMY